LELRLRDRLGEEPPLVLLLVSSGGAATEPEPERTLSIFFLVERVNFIMVVVVVCGVMTPIAELLLMGLYIFGLRLELLPRDVVRSKLCVANLRLHEGGELEGTTAAMIVRPTTTDYSNLN